MTVAPTDGVLIWSYEHNAWWGAQSIGYTRDLLRSGVYDRAEATDICRRANIAGPFRVPGVNAAIREVDAELERMRRMCTGYSTLQWLEDWSGS